MLKNSLVAQLGIQEDSAAAGPSFMTTINGNNTMLRFQHALTGFRQHGGMPASRRGWMMLLQLWVAGLFVALLAACGGGGGSSSTSGAAPGAPSAVTATAGDNETTISWGAVAGATSYNVYRSTTPGGQGTKIAATTTTSYVDATAANGTTYYYQVTADNAAGEGSVSTQSPGVTPAVPVAVPTAPTGMNATPGDAQVTINWTAVAGARSYNVYRSTGSGSLGAKVGSSSTTQYVDAAVSNGSTYYYAVTADNAAGEGVASAQTSGVTPAAPVSAPAAPTGINVVAGNGQVTVSWSAVPSATSYNVYRSTSAGTRGPKVGSSATTSFDDATAANGATYYYVVTANNAAGESAASASSPAATPSVPVTVPPAPTAVNAVAGNALVTVTWTAAPSASSYNVYRSTSQGSQGSLVGSSATSSYSDTTVVNGTTYYYVVTATNAVGQGHASTQSAGATPQVPLSRPTAPTGVNATAGNAQVTVTWTTAATATSYNVYRSTTLGAQGTKIGSSVTVSFTDSTSVNGTTYYYQVTAVNAAGESTPSTRSSGATPTVPLAVPAAPASVNATDAATQVTVSWTAVSGATSYKVYRSTTPGVQGASIGSTASTSLTDSTVVNGAIYYFVVTASNAAGEGAPSAAASVTHGTHWTNAKIGGGGYVTGLIFHPTTANLLYARTDIGGAYRWNQATSSWLPITDGLGAAESFFQGAESIALDPNNDQLVYMSTGLYDSANATARLYISSDRGDHWTHVNLPFSAGSNNGGRAMGERMMVDPNLPSTLYYGSRTAGLWKSADSGRTWAQVSSLSATKMSSDQLNAIGGTAMGVELVLFDTGTKGAGTATKTIYAAIAPDYVNVAGLGSNLYKSADGGSTWTPVSTPISGYHIPHMVRAADGMFYVAFTKGAGPGDGGPGRFYKFDGATWTLLAKTDSAGYGGVSVYGSGATTRIALGVSGTWGNYAGQQIVQLSDDDGGTWREIEAGMPHTPSGGSFSGWVDDIEIDPSNRDHILHVHGGGIGETRNASSPTPSWAATVDGIEENAISALATPPAGAPYIVINSAGDIGSWVHTDLTRTPTEGPSSQWSNGYSADMAWSDSLYIAGIGSINNTGAGFGFWSGDGGKTWASFATNAPGGTSNTIYTASIAVTARNKAVWAPSDSVPSYTTDNGASWTSTNLPTLPSVGTGISRGYHLATDRRNPNKVYAYDSGGAWWASAGRVYVSTDGGRSFTLSQNSVSAGLAPNNFSTTSLAVNPNAEGDVWLADGNAVYHSLDSGATWTKLANFASINGSNAWPDVQGATAVALGKPAPGAAYSAAVYVVGVINGVWGVHRSDDGGATWTRFNDDAHQYGGIGAIAADQNAYGRIYIAGNGRGLIYSN